MGQDLPATEARRTDALKRPDASNASLALRAGFAQLATPLVGSSGQKEPWYDGEEWPD